METGEDLNYIRHKNSSQFMASNEFEIIVFYAKEKGIVRQRFMIGNYGPCPYFKKTTGTWHNGTRNYYYCARRSCLPNVKQDINGSDVDISFVKNELLKSDCEGETLEKMD